MIKILIIKIIVIILMVKILMIRTSKFLHQASVLQQPKRTAPKCTPLAAHRTTTNIKLATYTWSFSRIKRNQLQHSINGNPPTPSPVSQIPSKDQKALIQKAVNTTRKAMQKDMEEQSQRHTERMDAQAKKYDDQMEKIQKNHQAAMAELKQMITTMAKPPPPPPPPTKHVTFVDLPKTKLFATEIDNALIESAIQAQNWKDYCNHIGNEGRWLLLQQMQNNPNMTSFVPQCANDTVQVARNWPPNIILVVDAILSTGSIPMQNAETLKSNTGEAIVNLTNRRVNQNQLKRSRESNFSPTPAAKRQRGSDTLGGLPNLPPNSSPTTTQGWAEVLQLLQQKVHGPAVPDVNTRLAHLEQQLRNQGPTNEINGRQHVMNPTTYTPGYISEPPTTKPTTTKSALDEVHAWLNGNSDSFPSFEKIFKSAQKPKSFDRTSLADIREALLILQQNLLTTPVPTHREVELRRQFLEIEQQLNAFTGYESIERETTCQQFCESVVREKGFGQLSRAVLINGVATNKNLEARRTSGTQYSNYSNNYSNNKRYGGRYNNHSYNNSSSNYRRNSYNKYGPKPGYRDRVVDGDYYATGRFVPAQKFEGHCYYCLETGHIQDDCPYALQGRKVDRAKFCVSYNNGGRHACRGSCGKIHRCMNCGVKHPRYKCERKN